MAQRAVSAKCLDDGKVYAVPSTGVVDVPVRRSTKVRLSQRVQETMGLKARTKDVAFMAARSRVKQQGAKVAALKSLFEQHDEALRRVLALQSEMHLRLEDLAKASPLEKGTSKFVAEFPRKKHAVEQALQHFTTGVRGLCQRWHAALSRADREIARDFDAARLQRDHYSTKADALRKAKEKRDLARLEKELEQEIDGLQVVVANDAQQKKADERYQRNEAKRRAAETDLHTTTASAIRAYDTIVNERWHELAPIVGYVLQLERRDHKAHADANDTLDAVERLFTATPTLVPLQTRIVKARSSSASAQPSSSSSSAAANNNNNSPAAAQAQAQAQEEGQRWPHDPDDDDDDDETSSRTTSLTRASFASSNGSSLGSPVGGATDDERKARTLDTVDDAY
mmetsp:Transcript_26656/g.86308  ORF Transcript_26656/g.86308 Transcript_26656/m.86308 type:complete len:398 (+) Transcript_26656:82-1275(+)|eukprot:CAMPEP_0118900884 /NCGR_PEP_ID=MMETSP1166-20130328/6813_1 /TAXON_ID=1104430 /ORGANISM="Chrysoreinhardia sp, Strain CCMP3193" /LENGTH=397 /DNA_ID=CAMNT_0006840039 /DNA_START=67 /DNA_END=1260 /DNA_ORIENTATION=+